MSKLICFPDLKIIVERIDIENDKTEQKIINTIPIGRNSAKSKTSLKHLERSSYTTMLNSTTNRCVTLSTRSS